MKEVTCPILFIHGQEDTLIPFEHTIKLKENCICPYEVLLPEEMNHNQFDYEMDLIFPLKDFLRRHTGFKSSETCDIEVPSFYFDIPLPVREMFKSIKAKNTKSSMTSCFCGDNPDNLIEKENKEKENMSNFNKYIEEKK